MLLAATAVAFGVDLGSYQLKNVLPLSPPAVASCAGVHSGSGTGSVVAC